MKKYIVLALWLLLVPLCAAADITLEWDASPTPSVTGYKIHYGLASGVYDAWVNVGNVLTHTITGLDEGKTYYFVASAYNPDEESDYSNEISKYFPYTKPQPPQSLRERIIQALRRIFRFWRWRV